jgi:RNA polymerase sigma-70 factor (ECF subfamily)
MKNSSQSLQCSPPANDQTSVCELSKAALAGQRKAWNQLIALHNRAVVLTLVSRGCTADRARELAQESWLTLIQKQRSGRLRELRLPGLAIAQALFLARDEARRARVIKPHLRFEDCEGSMALDPQRRLAKRDRLQRVTELLQDAPPRAREIFALLYSHPGIRHDEIARQVGLSVQRVRQIICEVRKGLRAALDED